VGKTIADEKREEFGKYPDWLDAAKVNWGAGRGKDPSKTLKNVTAGEGKKKKGEESLEDTPKRRRRCGFELGGGNNMRIK